MGREYKSRNSRGKKFPVQLSISKSSVAPNALYINGLGGKGNQVSYISKFFNQNGINLVTFDRNEKTAKSSLVLRMLGKGRILVS